MLNTQITAEVPKLVTQYIARQPIFDAETGIYAYELLYRDSINNAFPIGTTDGQATGRLFFNALMLIGINKLTANQRAFINLSSDALLDDFPKLLQPDSAVIEIVERADNIDKVTSRVTTLKKDGYTFALDDYDGDEKWEPLLHLVDYIKLEVEEPIIKTNMLLKKLKRRFPDVKIIVERIETHEQFMLLKSAGCDYFQGFFFARPEMLSYHNVEPSKFAVFDLLRCTSRPDLDFDEVHQRVAKDVGLTARILKLVNARSGNQNLVITSISQAVIYLGEDAIRQFVRVLALSELGVDKPSELTKLGLTRAHFMQLMLEPGGKEMSQRGYLVGLMSVLDAILNMELDVIAKEFCLGDDLSSALLNFNGMLGATLQLARAVEEDNWPLAVKLLETIRPASPIDVIYNAMLVARQYGDEVLASIIEDT
ncbi:MAG: EAL and modified HD-GYP domain-containing signal transduction protein [Pseudoalteromonas rhizosphaerae]|jgi:EAL and modified HD-GYP domain-containing signal transduction protein|uniref:EAL domain-containing protein n=1 Tax=Pseudoalteromonas neustonica TaxID=1840331 RepID=A0ABY3FDG5_9GAMM|nr:MULTISPECIES: EAL domain-containing protein [Pseudoalteromonas]MBB1508067.1 EAL domain-containing protein [Pseudoalteromonas sp. SG41-1]TVU83214.1 EAL domain-containing protein [Pseudoalteromonas neustonica]